MQCCWQCMLAVQQHLSQPHWLHHFINGPLQLTPIISHSKKYQQQETHHLDKHLSSVLKLCPCSLNSQAKRHSQHHCLPNNFVTTLSASAHAWDLVWCHSNTHVHPYLAMCVSHKSGWNIGIWNRSKYICCKDLLHRWAVTLSMPCVGT